MIEIKDAYELIAGFIEIVIDDPAVTVIYANGNAPRPKKPFITLQIDSLRNLAMPFRYDIDDEGLQQVVTTMGFTAKFNAYADVMHQAEELLNKLQRHFGTEIAYLHFQGDVSYMETVFGVSAIPVAENVINESRASMECIFNLNQVIQDNVGLIETIEVDETIDNDNKITNITIEIKK